MKDFPPGSSVPSVVKDFVSHHGAHGVSQKEKPQSIMHA